MVDICPAGDAQRMEFQESHRQAGFASVLGEVPTGCVAAKGGQSVDMLWEWTGWVVAAIAATFAIRGSIRFDVNEWLKDRRKRQEEQLENLCPHIAVFKEDGKLAIRSTYISPPGTVAWQCQMCGHVTHDGHAIEQGQRYWAENPDKLAIRNKRIKKLARKLGRM